MPGPDGSLTENDVVEEVEKPSGPLRSVTDHTNRWFGSTTYVHSPEGTPIPNCPFCKGASVTHRPGTYTVTDDDTMLIDVVGPVGTTFAIRYCDEKRREDAGAA